ncbi:MAG: hypothetical protein F4070_07180 [Acidimicrobiales bacterium]|nr:hypothetical protein [Acidimicrobiales bacterium]
MTSIGAVRAIAERKRSAPPAGRPTTDQRSPPTTPTGVVGASPAHWELISRRNSALLLAIGAPSGNVAADPHGWLRRTVT